jgi:hypothetical protein
MTEGEQTPESAGKLLKEKKLKQKGPSAPALLN